MLFWLLIILGLLMLLAVAILIACCICPGCPFYMAPRKRRVHSSETLVVRADGRPKRHLHRQPAIPVEGINRISIYNFVANFNNVNSYFSIVEWKETSVERGSDEKKLAIQQKEREKLFPSRGCCLHFRPTERYSHESRGSKIERRNRETFLWPFEEKQNERARKNVYGGYRRSKGKGWLPHCRVGIFATARDGQRFGPATSGLQAKVNDHFVSRLSSTQSNSIQQFHSFQRRSNKKREEHCEI